MKLPKVPMRLRTDAFNRALDALEQDDVEGATYLLCSPRLDAEQKLFLRKLLRKLDPHYGERFRLVNRESGAGDQTPIRRELLRRIKRSILYQQRRVKT